MTSYTRWAIIIACCVSIAILSIGIWSNLQYTDVKQKEQESKKKETNLRDSLILSVANRLDSMSLNETNMDSIMSAKNTKADSSIVLLNKIINNQKRALRKK